MRMMRNAETMGQLPRSRSAGGGRSALQSNPMMGAMMAGEANQPDYSQFTWDPQAHAAAQKYLGQFGLSPLAPNQVQPNAVLPNTGFFGNHPRLSGMIEGGMFGAAATRGSDTWGEGIANVAGGLIEGRQARAGVLNKQYARPFESARMLESMEDMSQKRNLQESQIQEQRSLAELHKAQISAVGKGEFHTTPMTKGDSGYVSTNTITGESTYKQNPDYNPDAQARSTGAISDTRRAFEAVNGPEPPPGTDAAKKWGKGFADFQITQAGGKAGASARATIPGKDTSEQLRWVDSQAAEKEFRRQFLATKGHDLRNYSSSFDEWKETKRAEIKQKADSGTQFTPPSSGPTPSNAPKGGGTSQKLLDSIKKKTGVGQTSPGPQSSNFDPWGNTMGLALQNFAAGIPTHPW